MALDASTVLDAPQIVGLQVSPLGTYSRTVSNVGPGNPTLWLGSMFWRVVLRRKRAAESAEAMTSDAPDIDGRGYLAVSSRELVLVDVRVGARVSLGDTLAEVPFSDIASAELRSGGMPGASIPLIITFRDGRRWIFEAGWLTRGRASKLVETLNGH